MSRPALASALLFHQQRCALMRPAYPLLPWFLILSLCAASACGDLFRISACELDRNHPLCWASLSRDMGMQGEGNGGTADLAGPTLLVMKPPVSFTMLIGSSLSLPNGTRKWVGMRSGNIILFANQRSGDPNANLEVYKLGPGLADPSKFDLIASTCPACPISIQNVDLTKDNLLTSKSKIFLIRPEFAYLLNADGSVPSTSINPVTSKLISDFLYTRPFVSPDADVLSFQRGLSSDNTSQVNFYSESGNIKTASVENRTTAPTVPYYYAIGRLYRSRSPETTNQLIIFEEKSIKSSYQIDASDPSGYVRDPDLANEIHNTIDRATGNKDKFVRSTFIADLNQDGFAELIYARGAQIYVSSYNPSARVGSKFTEWPQINLNINGIDITLTLTATDLTGDGYPELAVETNNPHMVYFFLNNAN